MRVRSLFSKPYLSDFGRGRPDTAQTVATNSRGGSGDGIMERIQFIRKISAGHFY